MNDHPRDRVPSGRDIVGAWLFCVLIAGLAFALSADLHAGVPPAATIAASRGGAVPGLHRLALPTLRRDLVRPG